MFWKKYKEAMIFGSVLAVYTGYVLLDTFVIPRSFETAVSQESSAVVAAQTGEETGGTDSGNTEAAGTENEGTGYASSAGKAMTADGSGNSESGVWEGSHHGASSDTADPSAGESGSDGQTGSGQAKDASVGQTGSDEAKGLSVGQTGSDEVKGSTVGQTGNDQAEEISGGQTGSGQTAGISDAKSLNLSGGTVRDTYSSDGVTITLYEYREQDTQIYVADVELDSADALKTAFAKETYGKNVTAKTSEIAQANDAVLAVNGDFYGAREKGYVIRNGTLYRDTSAGDQEDLVIYGDGSFEVINESDVTAQELLDRGAVQVLSFGPALLSGGQTAVSEGEEVGKAMASNPRTAIGIVDSLHYVFVVSDGRTQDSEGLSLSELASFLNTLGVETAYNLDGGGSSTMYFKGAVVNQPTTSGRNIKERSVSDIVYIQ